MNANAFDSVPLCNRSSPTKKNSFILDVILLYCISASTQAFDYQFFEFVFYFLLPAAFLFKTISRFLV